MRTRILLVCLLIGGWLTATADDLHPRHREALFYHLQGDSLEAGAHAMALQSRSEQTDPRLALLLAEIQIAYSMPKNAETTLMGVGADQVPHLASDLAWERLARLAYDHNQADLAVRALSRLSPEAPGTQQLLLHALLDLRAENPQSVLERVGEADLRGDSALGAYLGFNRALALHQVGKVQDAVRLWDEIATADARTEDSAEVADFAAFAAGIALLQAQDAGAAQQRFARVRTESVVARRAILAAGWAAAEQGAHRRALGYWRLLARGTPRDGDVLQALLAVPVAELELGRVSSAQDAYQHAIEVLESEQNWLTALVDGLGSGRWTPSGERLIPMEEAEGAEHLIQTLMANPGLQAEVRRVQELDWIGHQLAAWTEQLEHHELMLRTRAAGFDVVIPRIAARLKQLDLDALQDRQTRLQSRLSTAQANRDHWALATAKERSWRRQVDDVRERLMRMTETEEAAGLQERVDRLAGVLDWQVHSAFPQRRWDATKGVREVETFAIRLEGQVQRLGQARSTAWAQVLDMTRRVQDLRVRISAQRRQLVAISEAQQQFLKAQVLAELKRRQNHTDSYLAQARFALARLHDRELNRVAGR